MKKVGYVTGDLAFGQTKFMGVCRSSTHTESDVIHLQCVYIAILHAYNATFHALSMFSFLVFMFCFGCGSVSARLPGGLHRRLDIRCMPEDQYHFGTSSVAVAVVVIVTYPWIW